MMNEFKHKNFPNSLTEPFIITSPQTTSYNCIAWACEDDSKWYWPDRTNFYYWPPDLPRDETLSSFIRLFQLFNYERCSNGEFEEGFTKIAIYTDIHKKPTHAARQLENGWWTSKLGQSIDICHSIHSMSDGFYGNVEVFMKRKIKY